ncbi:hypothetical protein [uncultured Deinococcus sp.]|uniref:hypothetical protein n=1 Tax=uncultured Deinococcus sp. TaxID=158789 RepID=UPI0025DE1C11|nr:hypothetical protein [uncultured Deinococcus sp.]
MPLLTGEVVHQRDGDSTNTVRENLMALISQPLHTHLEVHLCRAHRARADARAHVGQKDRLKESKV